MRGNTLKPLDMAQILYLVAMWTVVLFLSITAAQAGQVNLAWNASSGPVAGYQVHYGTSSGNYTNNVNAGNTTAYTVANLADGATYYFAVKAYDGAGNQSGFSNEVSKTLAAVAPAPVANFSATPTAGAAPLAVQFANSSTNATSWSWNFGDGTSSTAQNPAKTYASAGTYTVSLTATGSGGSHTATKTGYITVNQPTAPVANFSATPTSGTAPLTVQFANSSTNSTSWSWNFGDGTSSTAQNPSKTYSNAGTYTVSLTATGSGGSHTATKTNYIAVNQPAPVASFTASPTSGTAPLLVTFSCTSTGSITSRSWDFGDGTTSTAQNAVKTYESAGTYTAKLTVTGPGGSSTTTKTISTTATAPVANFSATPTSGTAPLATTFTDTSTGTITGYAWDFGDGTSSTAQHPAKTYANAGAYTVKLTVTGPAGSNTKTLTSYINATAASASTGGLVAAYNFEEASGNTVVDASGNGNHGTISGATRITSGKFGRALSFDGIDDWVTIPHAASLNLTNGMTLEAWVYPTATMRGWQAVVLKEETGSGVYYLYANSDMNRPAGIVETSNNSELVTSGKSQLPVNTWTHLAVTYNGQYQRLYVNGVEVAAQPQTGTTITSNGALRIGGTSIWNEFFKGHIDEIRVYNRALSATEIATDMNAAIVTSSPPKRLLGEQALGSVSDALPQRTAAAFQTTAVVTGQITSLPVYVDAGSAATSLIAGLYADSNGRPGALLATGTLSSPKAGSWNAVLLPATKVTAGAKYWVAILSPSGQLKFRNRVGSIAQPSETSKSTRLTSLPSTWATGTISANGPLSGYGAGY